MPCVSQQFLPIPRQPLYLPACLLPRFALLPPMVILRRLVHRELIAVFPWAMVLPKDFAHLACSKVFFGSDTNAGARTHTRTNTKNTIMHRYIQETARSQKCVCVCVCARARAFVSFNSRPCASGSLGVTFLLLSAYYLEDLWSAHFWWRMHQKFWWRSDLRSCFTSLTRHETSEQGM